MTPMFFQLRTRRPSRLVALVDVEVCPGDAAAPRAGAVAAQPEGEPERTVYLVQGQHMGGSLAAAAATYRAETRTRLVVMVGPGRAVVRDTARPAPEFRAPGTAEPDVANSIDALCARRGDFTDRDMVVIPAYDVLYAHRNDPDAMIAEARACVEAMAPAQVVLALATPEMRKLTSQVAVPWGGSNPERTRMEALLNLVRASQARVLALECPDRLPTSAVLHDVVPGSAAVPAPPYPRRIHGRIEPPGGRILRTFHMDNRSGCFSWDTTPTYVGVSAAAARVTPGVTTTLAMILDPDTAPEVDAGEPGAPAAPGERNDAPVMDAADRAARAIQALETVAVRDVADVSMDGAGVLQHLRILKRQHTGADRVLCGQLCATLRDLLTQAENKIPDAQPGGGRDDPAPPPPRMPRVPRSLTRHC